MRSLKLKADYHFFIPLYFEPSTNGSVIITTHIQLLLWDIICITENQNAGSHESFWAHTHGENADSQITGLLLTKLRN